MKFKQVVLSLVVLVPLFFLIGCGGGPRLYPVTGKAMYKGQPMAGGNIFLNRKDDSSLDKVIPAGQIKEDGSFEILTNGKSGAPVGTYKVTFFWAGAKNEKQKGKKGSFFGGGNSEGPGDNVLPPEYRYHDKAKIEVTVKAETNQLEPFDIK